MEVSIYRISFNFSDRVYIGQSVNVESRTKAHVLKISRLAFCVQNEKRKAKNIKSDSSLNWLKSIRGFNFQMYLDALAFFRDTKIKPCITKIDVIDSVVCGCQSHQKIKCHDSLILESKHIQSKPNYNGHIYHG